MNAVTKLKCSHEIKFYDLTGFLGNLLTVNIEKLCIILHLWLKLWLKDFLTFHVIKLFPILLISFNYHEHVL